MPADPAQATLLIPDYLLPAADADVASGRAILVEGNRITALGTVDELLRRRPDAERIELPDCLMMPGLINAHQHGRGLSQLQLGYPDDRLELWIARRRVRGAPDPYPLGMLAAMEMLRNGVTCAVHANISYGSGDYEAEVRASLRAYEQAGLRATVCIGAADRSQTSQVIYPPEREARFIASLPAELRAYLQRPAPPAYAGDADATMALMQRLLADFAGHPRLRLCYGPAGPQWVSDELFRRLATDAEARGLGLHLHVLESPLQQTAAADLYPEGTLSHLDALGVLGPRTVLAHGVYLSDADMALAARRGVTLVTNPGSNRRLYNGTARLAALLRQGVRVAIGSDNSAFNDDEDLLSELRLAGILARSPDRRAPPAPGAAELLAMATLAGAAAARFDGEIGRLAPGWRADLVAVSLARIRGAYLDPDMPLPDALVFRGRGRDVRLTMVDGRVCYRDGVFPHLDPDTIATAAAETARAARRPRDPADVESARRLHEHLRAFLAAER